MFGRKDTNEVIWVANMYLIYKFLTKLNKRTTLLCGVTETKLHKCRTKLRLPTILDNAKKRVVSVSFQHLVWSKLSFSKTN